MARHQAGDFDLGGWEPKMRAKCMVVPCLFLVGFGVQLSRGQASKEPAHEPQAEALVAAYENFLKPFEKCTFLVKCRYVATGRNAGPEGWRNVESYRVWRHGNLLKEVSWLSSEHKDDKGKLVTSRDNGERIYAGDMQMVIGYDETNQAPDGIVASLGGLSDEERDHMERRFFSPVVNGKMLGNREPLPEVLRKSRLTAKVEVLEGRRLHVVGGSSPWGYHAVWLDLERGGLPRRIVQRKHAQDKMMDWTLATIPKELGGPEKLFLQQLDVTNSALVDGKPVVTGFTLVQQSESQQGGILKEEYDVTMESWDLNPDFGRDPFVPSIVIPNGHPVTVRGQTHIDYEWRDGKIVKKVNDGTLVGLARHWFQRGSVIGNSVVLLVLASVIGLGVYLWCRRRPVVPH